MTTASGLQKELVAEDYCFICKDGGSLLICDYGDCLKAYHPNCVGKDPTFAETGANWKCGWHSCSGCQKSSSFRCFCCPKSLCQKCFKNGELLQVKENSKGFCRHCLKLIMLIEENSNVDSDGDEVDFNDTDTYEFLFKDYWEIIKDREKISFEEIRAAYTSLKDGKNLDYASEKSEEKDNMGFNDIDDTDFQDSRTFHASKLKSRSNNKRRHLERKIFTGWGTEELMAFLTSLGKDCREPITQLDASDIIKRYIYDNNLLHPEKKKKKVLCDQKLYSLFKKKSIKLLKIFDLLESHYSSDDVDDYNFFDLEEKEFTVTNRQQATKLDPKNAFESPRSCYASIVDKNIKLIYLKRSLILELLENFGEFENKVVGCFVRVKNDPKDFLYSRDKIYQLGQVTGIKKTQETYQIGEKSADVVLCVSNMFKDIHLSMLSDDDFEEEELEDLLQLVKNGHHKRPTIAEFELKSILLHEDITRHWINKEIVTLKKQIDRANEKGWRRELHDMIDRRELLRTDAEQARLLKEIPRVIPDTEIVSEGILDSKLAIKRNEDEAALQEDSALGQAMNNNAGSEAYTSKSKSEGSGAATRDTSAEGKGDGAAVCNNTAESNGNGSAAQYNPAESNATGFERVVIFSVQREAGFNTKQFNFSAQKDKAVGEKESTRVSQVIEIDDDNDNDTCRQERPSQTQIINLDDEDEDEDEDAGRINRQRPAGKEANSSLWNYLDPLGTVRGSFNLEQLKWWRQLGFFDDNFKVWRVGESRDEAILLTDALRLL